MPEETWEERRHVQYRRHFLVDNSVFHVERCMSVMQSGTQMIKLKRGTKGLVRLFYLDEHRTRLRWRPSRKSEKAKIPIDSIYKVTEGRQSELFHRQAEGSADPSCCFTIYHGDHMESLDLITTNPEEARTWITGLKYLMAGISDEDSLAKRQRTHDQWVKQTFEEADKNGDGLLSIEEIHQLMRKLNVNLPRRKVRQMFQEADTDENQGTLTFEEFCVFYKMMSLRRDLYLLLLSYSDKKDHLTVDELAQFLKVEQKVNNVTADYCLDIIKKFEVSEENKAKNVLGIEGFTNFMRSPACDVFNPGHQEVCQDMDQPLCHYYIASSHNTYLTGDQLLSQSRVDMYARVLQEGCRCLEVDCWDGPEGEPVVHHGYTLTSKILFRDVVETINKHAFVKNEFPVILSIENHCSIQQQRKIAQYLKGILGDRLDLSCVDAGDGRQLPSPQSLKGKVLVKHFLTAVQWSKRFKDMGSVPICADTMQHLHEGKKLPYHLGEDAEEGEVSDEDSADEIEDECKFKLHCNNGTTEHQVESFIRKKLESLLKESQIRDKEDPDSFTVRALLKATHEGLNAHLGQSPDGKESGKKSQARALVTNFGKHKKATKSRSKMCSMEEEEDPQQNVGRESGQLSRLGRRRKTMKLCRELSDLVIYTNSVAAQDIVDDGTTGNVLSFSETRAHQVVQQKPEQVMAYNQRQLTRVYPSAYRIDSSNFNPLPYWNAGCQLVALNYQSEGRMMQLNRAKFKANGNCGYVLKPQQMCKGTFNPFSGDPLPANPKKQLILKVISGQQLPKPPDSMFGDRGEIIDPFVEVEIIGLPVDCCKDQTRVVDDNGFNPVWEETLTFTVHMPEIALVRFLVWDHDPIGRDFVGQRTVTFTSLVPGYRHVYLEGLTEASIFVHITINEIYGKWSPLILNPSYTILHILGASKSRQLQGLKGLFNKTPRHCSSENGSHCVRKRSIGDRILRRTASAPAKGRKKTKMGFQEVVEVKDSVSEATRDQGGVLRRTTRSLQARPVSMPVDRGLLGALVAPAVTGGKESSPAEDKDGRKTGQASRKGLPFPDFSKELSSPSSSTLHKDTSLGGTWGVSTTRAGAAAGQSAMPGPQRGSHQSQATSDACQESHRPIRSPGIPAHSLPDVQAKDAGRAEGSADSTLSPGGLEAGRAWARASLSLSDVSRLCSPTSDLHSTAILQDTDVSLLLDNITLTGDTEPGSSISTLIAHFEEHHTRADGPSPASQHGGSGVEAAPSFLSPRELPSPEITGTSHPPRSKPKPTDAPCAENWPRALNAPHGGPLQTPPRGRHWELLSSHNSATATDRTPGHILADPTLCTDSGGSSLVEVDGESGNVSLTICDDGGVCATPLACPLKRKYGRTVLEPCPRGWRNGYCKELLWSPISEILPNGQRAPGQGFQGAGSVHSHISALDRRGQQVSEPQQCTARAVLAPGPAPRLPSPLSSPCKSKSLGDLTSEDIACNFESKYECISRSFVPAGGLGRAGVAAGMPCLEPLDALTEQLRRLVSFDQEDSCEAQDSGHEASQLPRTLVRKLSSRSQSRVRNIASRAKEKQEASRQKGGEAGPGGGVVLRKRPPAPGLGVNRHSTGSYIAGYLRHSKGGALEGRGIPEGACAALHGGCVDQFRPDDSVLQTEPSPDDKPEIYFLLRL